jgi:hypothetical protein
MFLRMMIMIDFARDEPIKNQAMNSDHGSAHGTSKRKRVTRSNKQPKRTKLNPDEEEEVISSSSSDEDTQLPIDH